MAIFADVYKKKNKKKYRNNYNIDLSSPANSDFFFFY